MEIDELYKKVYKSNIELSDALEFIREAAKIFKPDYPYNESNTLLAFQLGMGEEILRGVRSAVESNPTLVGFQITKVYDKSGNLIKILTKKLKQNGN